MFNDLNNPNQAHQAVDDIFAETDKPMTDNGAAASAGGIETKRVGLTANEGMLEEGPERGAGNRWFKIILIVIIAAIAILCGFLVYSKFFRQNSDVAPIIPATPSTEATPASTPTPSESQEPGSFVTPASQSATEATGTESQVPQIPGVNAPAIDASTTSLTTPPASQIDSDNDGLTDAEEKTAGTNINLIDTDNDGLSDYEEVKIYHTNPLSADTDSDTYLDGAEVKSGYNPNGAGKLTDATSTPVR